MVELVKFDGEHANTKLAKQLFMWDKKKKDNMFLISADVNTQIDIKALTKYLKVGSGNLRGCDEDVLNNVLGSKKGAVNFFSIVNDTEKKVKMILDKVLYGAEWVSFHPMDNTASTCISKEGIDKIKELTGRDESNFEVLDFSSIGSGEAPPAKTEKGEKKPKVEQGKKMTVEEKKKKKEEEKA